MGDRLQGLWDSALFTAAASSYGEFDAFEALLPLASADTFKYRTWHGDGSSIFTRLIHDPVRHRCSKKHIEVVSNFLQRAQASLGADELIQMLEHRDQKGNNALHYAAEASILHTNPSTSKCYQIVGNILALHGTKEFIDSRSGDGRAALHVGTTVGDVQTVAALLAAGASVDLRDTRQLTALHVAANSGNGDMIKVLLAAGADKDKLNADGQTPWQLAGGQGFVRDLFSRMGGNAARWQLRS